MSPSKKISRSRARSRRLLKSQALPKIKNAVDPTGRLNQVLVTLREKSESQLEYWRAYQNYLVGERELRKDAILNSLRSVAISGYEQSNLVRIVDSRFQNRPLSSYGSVVVPPGGRFNFGEISSYHKKFQALYVASSFGTAASERFLKDQSSEDAIDFESLNFRLDPDASFTSYRIKITDLRVIDIRSDDALRPFLKIISEIEAPAWLRDLAKKKKQSVPRTVKTLEELKLLLHEPLYTQWGALIDQPSASQWFGYYAREAGLHGVVYNSVRNKSGYNIAIFPDNFIETAAKIELVDDAAGVKKEDRVLDSSNAIFQMQSSHVSLSELRH